MVFLKPDTIILLNVTIENGSLLYIPRVLPNSIGNIFTPSGVLKSTPFYPISPAPHPM